jgi:hypothetical protein
MQQEGLLKLKYFFQDTVAIRSVPLDKKWIIFYIEIDSQSQL